MVKRATKKRATSHEPRATKVSKKAEDISSIPIYSSKGKEVGTFTLDKSLFTGDVNKAVLYQAVLMYNANQRRGTASTKTRGDVSGGGKKPWRQKGTGRARAGSTRSPLWRHGGVVFGPHPRDFHYTMPEKVKRLAFLESLNSKLKDNALVGVESIQINEPKTKEFKAIVDALKLKGNLLFILDTIDEKIKRASRNLQDVTVKDVRNFNTMDVLGCDTLVVSRPALEKLKERL